LYHCGQLALCECDLPIKTVIVMVGDYTEAKIGHILKRKHNHRCLHELHNTTEDKVLLRGVLKLQVLENASKYEK